MTQITHLSETLTLAQWAERLDLHYDTLRKRYDAGQRPPRLFAASAKSIATTPITYNGQTMQLRHWAETLNIPYATLRMRYTRGHRPPELLGVIAVAPRNQPKTPSQVTITHWGKTRTLFEWSRALDIGFDTLHKHYTEGERDPARLLRRPIPNAHKAHT